MWCVRLAACAIFVCSWACADTVEMKPESNDPDAPGLKLEGKVARELSDSIIFSVYNESGQVRIPKSKIKNIEYDPDTQLEKIAEDDFAGRYKVGVWCIEKGKFVEAIKLFEGCIGKEGPGKDMLKLLGHAYEQRQQLDKAFESYTGYLKVCPDDAEIQAKIAELGKKVHPPEEAAAGGDPGAAAKPKVIDGLEGDGVWVLENWGNPGQVQVMADPNAGGKMVAIQTPGGQKDKTAISRTGQPLNLADSKQILFRVLHTSASPIGLAIAFVNAQGEFHETKEIRIPANQWVPVTQNILGKVFKANRNNFKDYNLELEGPERINRILFLVYSQRPFTMYMDSIYFK